MPTIIDLPKILVSIGMIPFSSPLTPPTSVTVLDVILDGRVLGVVMETDALRFVKELRMLKVTGSVKVHQIMSNELFI